MKDLSTVNEEFQLINLFRKNDTTNKA